MNMMNDLEAIINNKRYTLSGYESEEYLQKIASYINSKYTEFKKKENYNHLDPDVKTVLMEINIADDYYKAVKQIKDLEAELETKDIEIFDMKHELMALQEQLIALQVKVDDGVEELNEAQKAIVRLEAIKGKNHR